MVFSSEWRCRCITAGVNVNAHECDGLTPLQRMFRSSIRWGHFDEAIYPACRDLIDAGATTPDVLWDDGETYLLLHLVVREIKSFSCELIVDLLCQKNDINARGVP